MESQAPVNILVIDDEKVIRDGCERALAGECYQIEKAKNGKLGIEKLKAKDFDIVLLDLMMPGIDGFAVLKWIKENQPGVQVIVITGFATVSKAVAAMKAGAFDFVGKPFTPEYIRLVVKRGAEKRALEAETVRLRGEKELDHLTIATEQSRLKSVFQCMEGAILVTDLKGVVVLHNPAVIKMLEIETDPVIGKHLSESIRDRGAVNMIEEVVRRGSAVTREFEPGSISRLYLRAHCAPVQTDTDKVLGSVTVFEDITTHKRVDQLKSEFVAMVAHDLRAPLASIVQMIYAIKSYGDEIEKRQQLLDRISVRINDQLQFIENLLSLSRLETGTLVFNLEPVKGDQLLGDVVEVVRPRAQGKKIELKYEPSSKEWWVNIDLDQMRVVLTNIVDNAVKYTPEGGRVTVSSSASGSLAKVEVADTGIGIAAEDLPNIFDRFFRVRGKATRGITGSGIGLSLVKEVVEAHNGFIDVKSRPEQGTNFTISMPLVEPQPLPDKRDTSTG